ncbi:MAG: hypothetical protein ACM3SM_12460 [Bacteroidota bacterium]
MSFEIELFDNLQYHGNNGKLLFTRYQDGNPALLFKFGPGNSIIQFSINIPEFFDEYPFGAYRLIAINAGQKDVIETLVDSGIIHEPVFNVEFNDQSNPICEFSNQIMDLLNSCGEYYA